MKKLLLILILLPVIAFSQWHNEEVEGNLSDVKISSVTNTNQNTLVIQNDGGLVMYLLNNRITVCSQSGDLKLLIGGKQFICRYYMSDGNQAVMIEMNETNLTFMNLFKTSKTMSIVLCNINYTFNITNGKDALNYVGIRDIQSEFFDEDNY